MDYGLNNAAAVSQAGVNLTPELIATLSSLIPQQSLQNLLSRVLACHQSGIC